MTNPTANGITMRGRSNLARMIAWSLDVISKRKKRAVVSWLGCAHGDWKPSRSLIGLSGGS